MSRFELSDNRWMRLLDSADAGELFELIDSNREHLARWMPFVSQTRSAEDSLAFIRSARRQLAENRGMQLGIFAGASLIGVAGFHRVDWATRSTSIGYWLAEDRQGHGTMTLAAAAMLDHAFGVWRLQRVEIRAGVENHRSRAIPERLGFRETGVLRGAERIGARVIDHVIYAMTAPEWEPLSASRRPAASWA
ncbi:MAG TPA: GNAT family protein [Solirubrobacteraceae bacterium]|nr:GNAT family protein [Solirubrobacteraceae bacterium]